MTKYLILAVAVAVTFTASLVFFGVVTPKNTTIAAAFPADPIEVGWISTRGLDATGDPMYRGTVRVDPAYITQKRLNVHDVQIKKYQDGHYAVQLGRYQEVAGYVAPPF